MKGENTMKGEIKIYEQRLEEYPKASAVIVDFLMLLWIALELLPVGYYIR